MNLNEMVDAYLKYRGIERDDFEDDDMHTADEQYAICKEGFRTVINNIRTMPVAKAFKLAEKDGWVHKHFRTVVGFVTEYS